MSKSESSRAWVRKRLQMQSVYRELQRQAAGLGADAVLVISSQPAIQGGFATYDAWTGYGFAAGPSVIGLKLSGIALKRIKG
jgi:hypothetical protein